MERWSVTLTGALQAGADAAATWHRVAEHLGSDHETFEHQWQGRLPVTLRASGRDAAQHRLRQLEECGARAVLLADSGERIWVRQAQTTHGPVSPAYAEHCVTAGEWSSTMLACRQGQTQWQPLAQLLPDTRSSDALPPLPPDPEPPAVPGPPSSGSFRSATTAPAGTGELPVHIVAPGLHAGFWMRVAAWLLDALITCIPVGLLWLVNLAIPLLGSLMTMVGVWLYFALFEASSWQATPGKRIMGLRVVDMRGQRVGFGRATGRYFGKIISGMILDIGYMMAGWTRRKQALHDLMAECCVVRQRGLESLSAADHERPSPPTGMPAWAIALIVVGACFFLAVPVVAMMAAIAIPAYQNYLIRAQVMEGMTLSQGSKTAVSEYVARHGLAPANNRAAGLVAPSRIRGQYVHSVRVHRGNVVVTYGGSATNSQLRGEHLVILLHRHGDGVSWTCTSPDIADKYLPAQCRRAR